jgi:hypothetical protein
MRKGVYRGIDGQKFIKRERRQITLEDLFISELANAYLPIANGAEASEIILLDFIMRARELQERTHTLYKREECWVECDEEETQRGLA